MKKQSSKLLATLLISFIIFGPLAAFTTNQEKEYKPGDFVPEENAYFVEKIDDPTGLVKAHKFVTPTDNQYNSQKTRSLGTGLIGDIESVWGAYTGRGTTVAIIDDGFDYDHPEFTRSDGTSAILSTSRYYYASGNTAYYRSYSEDPTCIAEDWDSDENEWASHGTNTSTTAAAPMNNGGGVGIAPEADILALKIDFSFVAIKAAIQYAINQHVDVINMSLGAYAESFTDGWGESQTGSSSTATYLNSVCQNAYDAGIIVVAAAGNESTWHKSYPACNTKVIGVGAIGDWDNKGNANVLAEFTNYVATNQTGEINVDILAPGYVYTATQGGKNSSSHTHTYSDTQGTSFSCPIVAGAACLWKQKYPSGTPDQFLEDLQSTADGIGYYQNKYIPVSGWYNNLTDVGPSNITNGRLNVAKLLDMDEPYVFAVQSSLNISVGEKRQITLDTYNGNISYTSSNNNVATVSNSGLVEGKNAGNATITITATKNANTATTTINVTVNEAVAITSMAFSPDSIALSVGDTYDSEATINVSPNNASRIFLFESENENIATVNEDTGLVTAVAQGTTTINAVPIYGTGDASLSVTVSAPSSWDKVTSTGNVTDGDYLIVYGDGSKAFNGGLASLDATNNNISVSITSNSIDYSDETEAAKFTIQAVSGGFSIQSASGKYIGRSTSSNGIDTSTSDALVNTISISNGNATITGSGGKVLCFNTANDQQRFRYMSSGGAIQLYKLAGGGGDPTPTVTSVTVSPSSLNLDLYNNVTGNLSATVNGTNSPVQTVNWTSSNNSVASVNSSGIVTAQAVGSATITATSTADNTKSGTCTVNVSDSTPQQKTLSSISISGYTTSFTVGDAFSFGGTVTAHYSDSSSANVTASSSFTGYNMSVAGNYTVTVSYTYSGATKTATYQITVNAGGGSNNFSATYNYDNQGSTWTLSNSSDSTNYWLCPVNGNTSVALFPHVFEGKEVSSNVVITINSATYGSGDNPNANTFKIYNSEACTSQVSANQTGNLPSSSTYTNAVFTVSQANAASNFTDDLAIQINKPGKQIRMKSVTVEFTYTAAEPKVIASLSASYNGSTLYVGDELNPASVSVTATYTDSVKYPNSAISSSDYSLTGFSSITAGNKTVTVTYTGALSTATTPMVTTFNVMVNNDNLTSLDVVNEKTYHPGETIVKSDITATAHYESGRSLEINDFTFADDGYQFTYSDAPSGGSNGTKQFSISYNENNYNFSINVSRVAYVPVGASDTLTRATTGVSDGSSTYTNWSGKTGTSGAVYAGNSAGLNNSIQLRSNNNNSGIITTTSGGNVTKVTLSWNSNTSNGRVINVYGKNSAYYSASDLFNQSNRGTLLGTITYGTNTELEITGNYAYVGICSNSGALYLDSVTFSYGGDETPVNVSNFIMYEDTNNQCLTKLDVAIGKLNSMSSDNKNTFWTSNDYVIATARERLTAWATHEGKTLSYSDGAFTANNARLDVNLSTSKKGIDIILIVIVSSTALVTAFSFIYLKRKER